MCIASHCFRKFIGLVPDCIPWEWWIKAAFDVQVPFHWHRVLRCPVMVYSSLGTGQLLSREHYLCSEKFVNVIRGNI